MAGPHARFLGALCAACAVLVLSACGGSSASHASTSAQQEEARRVAFARCLRQHGVPVSPTSGGGFTLSGRLDAKTMEAARNACKRYAPPAAKQNLTPQERVAREEAIEKFVKCMREHGIELETSIVNGRLRVGGRAGGTRGGPNPSSPAFQSAMNACQGLLPLKGRRGRGGVARPGAPGGASPDTTNGG